MPTVDFQMLRLAMILPAIVFLVIVEIILLFSFSYLTPANQHSAILVEEVLASISPVLVGLVVLLKVEHVEKRVGAVDLRVEQQHQQMNGHMQELIKQAEESGFTRGVAEFKKKDRDTL